jgi:hypothetical protein
MMNDVAIAEAPLVPSKPLATLTLACLGLGFLLLLSLSNDLFNDGDTSWHLAAGRLILDSWAVPRIDPFSYTFLGEPWVAHEWLSEVLMAAAFNAAGWSGLAALTASAIGILFVLIGIAASRHMPPVYVAVLITGVFLILAPFILARPHVIAWPLLAYWTVLLVRARDVDRTPPISAALLMLVWANLHASFLFGLLLIGPFALEALLQSKDRLVTFKQWSLFGAASLALSLMTPHGIHGLLFPLQVSAMETLPMIHEWRATIPAESMGFTAVLLATIFFALHKGLKVPIVRLILLVALLFLAFQHVRHQAVLAIVGALILIEPIGRSIRYVRDGRPEGPGFRPALVAGLVAILIVVRLAIPTEQPQSATNPANAIAGLNPELKAIPVLNSYAFGGPLIINGIQPYIDGRADLYGDDFIKEFDKITSGDLPAFNKAVARWDIGWTILAPDEALVPALDRSKGWSRIYTDEFAVIHVRRPMPLR